MRHSQCKDKPLRAGTSPDLFPERRQKKDSDSTGRRRSCNTLTVKTQYFVAKLHHERRWQLLGPRQTGNTCPTNQFTRQIRQKLWEVADFHLQISRKRLEKVQNADGPDHEPCGWIMDARW